MGLKEVSQCLVSNKSLLTHRPPTGSIMFTTEQRTVLMRYFEEYGMTSTHRRNTELMQRCAQEVNTSIDRIKVRIAIIIVSL